MVSVSGSNPKPSCFYQLPETFVVTSSEFDDGGMDFALQCGGAGVKMWILEYAVITLAEAAILDAHLATAGYSPEMGSASSFNFRDRDTATLYSGVRYAPSGFERQKHRNRQSQARMVKLVKYP